MEQTSITDGNLTCKNMFIHLHYFDNIKNGSCDERFLIGKLYFVVALDFLNFVYLYELQNNKPFYITDVIGEVLDFRGQNIVKFGRKEVTKVEFNLRDIKFSYFSLNSMLTIIVKSNLFY